VCEYGVEKLKASVIEIQVYRSKNGFYENLALGKLDATEVVIGGHFRILVDGEMVYSKGGKED